MQRLRDQARERGLSIAQLVREAVDGMPPQINRAERNRRALAAVGRHASGLSDVSERHDDHLAEAFAD